MLQKGTTLMYSETISFNNFKNKLRLAKEENQTETRVASRNKNTKRPYFFSLEK